jgi:hypothetical protein
MFSGGTPENAAKMAALPEDKGQREQSAFAASRQHPAGEYRQDQATWFRDTGNTETDELNDVFMSVVLVPAVGGVLMLAREAKSLFLFALLLAVFFFRVGAGFTRG